MLAALDGMIAELRHIGVPISLSEKIDAVRSLQHLPLAERDAVKSSLRAVLVKSHDHELAFDALFDLYFSAPAGLAARPAPGAVNGHPDPDPGRASQGGASQDGAGQGGTGQGGDGQGGGGAGSLGSIDDAGLTE